MGWILTKEPVWVCVRILQSHFHTYMRTDALQQTTERHPIRLSCLVRGSSMAILERQDAHKPLRRGIQWFLTANRSLMTPVKKHPAG